MIIYAHTSLAIRRLRSLHLYRSPSFSPLRKPLTLRPSRSSTRVILRKLPMNPLSTHPRRLKTIPSRTSSTPSLLPLMLARRRAALPSYFKLRWSRPISRPKGKARRRRTRRSLLKLLPLGHPTSADTPTLKKPQQTRMLPPPRSRARFTRRLSILSPQSKHILLPSRFLMLTSTF